MSYAKAIAVDLDGTLAKNDSPFSLDRIGDPIEGAVSFMKSLEAQGLEIIIFTVRCSVEFSGRARANQSRRVIEEWLDKHDIPFDEVWMGEGKPNASAFVDDRAVSCRPMDNQGAYATALARIERLL